MSSWIDALLVPFVVQDWSFEGPYAYHTNGCILQASARKYLYLKTPLSEDFKPLIQLNAPLDWPSTLEGLAQSFDPVGVERLKAQLVLALWRSHPGRWVFRWNTQEVWAKYHPPGPSVQSFDAHALYRLLPLYNDILQLRDLLISGPSEHLHRFEMAVVMPSTWHELLETTGLPTG